MGRLLSILGKPLEPAGAALRRYSPAKLRSDLVAGLTVSVVEVPQAMAYALIAGVDPQYGIYTSIIQGVIGALVSSSEHLTTGPTNTQSLLVASATARLAQFSPGGYLQLVFGLTLLKGLIQLAFAAAKMGTMVRYVSRSVIVGVAAGAGVLIIVQQLPAFLGIELPPGPAVRHLPGVLGAVERLPPHLDRIQPLAIYIGLGCLLVVAGGRALSPFVPGALLAVGLSAALVAAMGWDEGKLPLVQAIAPSLPGLQAPRIGWRESEALFGGALALAVMGLLESVSIAKTLATRTGQRIGANREFFAQGLANFASSFFQCIPGSGSFTRSALDHAAGARTRFAAVFNALFVAAIFLLLGRQARFIPLASLAAVLFVIAAGLIDWRYIVRTAATSRSDAVVCILTALATIFAPLEYAIFGGIFLSIGLYLRKASRLHLAEMVHTPGGPFIERPIPIHDRLGQQAVMFLQVEGDLFFAVADELQEQLTAVARGGVRVVVLRLKRTHSMDATVLHALDQFVQEMRGRGGHVVLCGIRPEMMRVLRTYGLVARIGRENVFQTGYGIFESAKQALERARHLAGSSLDTDQLSTRLEAEELTYEI